MQEMMKKLMQVQAQKVDAINDTKVGETKLGAKLDAKHCAKDGTKICIKLGVKPDAKPITIPGTKLGVRLGEKNSANFASIFAQYLINGHKQHQKWALDAKKEGKRDANHRVLLQWVFTQIILILLSSSHGCF